MENKSTTNIVHSCRFHVVWCTKYRRKVLTNGVEQRLEEIIKATCKEYDADAQEITISPDSVSLLLEVGPQYGIHRLVKQLKARSSHELRLTFSECRTKLPSLWTNSYYVSTVGAVSGSAMERYVESQALK